MTIIFLRTRLPVLWLSYSSEPVCPYYDYHTPPNPSARIMIIILRTRLPVLWLSYSCEPVCPYYDYHTPANPSARIMIIILLRTRLPILWLSYSCEPVCPYYDYAVFMMDGKTFITSHWHIIELYQRFFISQLISQCLIIARSPA